MLVRYTNPLYVHIYVISDTHTASGLEGLNCSSRIFCSSLLKSESIVVTVYGLKGGHSGVEIGLGRANANKLLCELLYLMERELDVRVITMDGGTKDNVIPHEAKAQIACGAKEEELKKLIMR